MTLTLTQEVTLRDLLSHRTGLPRANNSLLIPYDRAETVRRMRFLKPVAGLRAQFTYQNQMYLAAGLAVERLSGLTWDEFVRRRIFDPLGMKAERHQQQLSQGAGERRHTARKDSRRYQHSALPQHRHLRTGGRGQLQCLRDGAMGQAATGRRHLRREATH
jgi:CubicO group peptidase (beta-lactamase class C family)